MYKKKLISKLSKTINRGDGGDGKSVSRFKLIRYCGPTP